ncbi:GNAT family N-acetyltransferase [Dickeya chrysanthemi]|uniref:GNAT family N-acetyltransferase n=1 Tax=Dickeya chrysanthemi TaxID=556 RepID=UPI0003A7E6EE|nr:GNAT family N-acetyltransferase [Dickeya chrysanthemi]
MKDTVDSITFRYANEADLSVIIDLLYDDELGSVRETKDSAFFNAYVAAFWKIQASPENSILLAETSLEIVGMLQLTLIPSLTHRGSLRAQIEGVRVKRAFRGQGIGRRLFGHAIELATRSGCYIVQLTTDRQRPDAVRFYKSLGFNDSHHGMKLILNRPESGGGGQS